MGMHALTHMYTNLCLGGKHTHTHIHARVLFLPEIYMYIYVCMHTCTLTCTYVCIYMCI